MGERSVALEYIHSFHLFRPAEAAKLCPGSHVAKSSKDLSAVMDASAGEVCEAATSSLQLSSVPLGLFSDAVIGKSCDVLLQQEDCDTKFLKFPMSSAMCAPAVLVGGSFCKTVDAWKQVSSSRPCLADLSYFPVDVSYRKPCGALCRVHEDASVIQMSAHLLTGLEGLLKRVGVST